VSRALRIELSRNSLDSTGKHPLHRATPLFTF